MERIKLHPFNGPKLEPPASVCCISPHESDKLRLISFPPSLLSGFRIAIQTSWDKGIQAEGAYGSSYQFKLGGNPWSGAGNEAVAARRLAMGIMRFMVSYGWGLEVATDVYKKEFDMDSWFFRKQSQETNVEMCSISFNKTDRIRIIEGFPEITEVVRSTVQQHWHRGLQKYRLYCDSPEFQLHGNPWTANGKETTQIRVFIMQLIDSLRKVGWIVYASVDISNGNRARGEDLDSWILKKVNI